MIVDIVSDNSPTVRILAFQARDLGSIPGYRNYNGLYIKDVCDFHNPRLGAI